MGPAGIDQAWAGITQGLRYARSPEIVYTVVWLRVPGGVPWAIGAAFLGLHGWRRLAAARYAGARRRVSRDRRGPEPMHKAAPAPALVVCRSAPR
jgi:hypothetical protein